MIKMMDSKEKIRTTDPQLLEVIRYPDPQLREVCTPIEEVDEELRALIRRMFVLMFESRGVGLAASQVGVTVRLFVASPTSEPDDCHVYINPRILSAAGTQNAEEGCLSFPTIFCNIKRAQTVTIEATDMNGQRFQQTCDELHSRIIQHENDHIDGLLLVDRMGSVAKLSHRKSLQTLEEQFAVGR